MKGMYWVTRSGGVVESMEEFSSRFGCPKVAPCKRVSSGAFLGTRRLDRLRPATMHEVEVARSKKR